MSTRQAEPRPKPTGFVHDAFFFDDDRVLVEATAGFLAGALASGELVTLACTDEHNQLLLRAMGRPDGVSVVPQSSAYRRAPAAIDHYRRLVQGALERGYAGIRAVGEVPFGPDPAGHREWGRFEAVCNPALAELPLWSTCVYDRSTTPEAVARTALATHPTVRVDGRRDANAEFTSAGDYLAQVADPPALPVEATEPAMALTLVEEADLRLLREQVRRVLAPRLRRAPRAGDRPWDGLEDQVLAVHEVADNAVRHGEPPVEVRAWVVEDELTVTVTDVGSGTDDPLAGWVRRGPASGLWLARQLCDDVDLRSNDGGFSVRLRSSLRG